MLNGLIGISRGSLIHNTYSTMRTSRLLYTLAFVMTTALVVVFVVYAIQKVTNSSAQENLELSVPSDEAEQLQNLYVKPLVLPRDETITEKNAASTHVDVNLNSSDPTALKTTGSMTVNGNKVELNGEGSVHKNISTTDDDGTTAVDISISSNSSGEENSQLDLQVNSQSEVRMKSQ